MASSPQASCLFDPNFAVICAFLERFANSCGISHPTFSDLQEMLENSEQVPQELADLHIKLLRKARKTVFIEKWEKALIKFCHTYSSQDGWEIERFGYKKSRLEVKLRALKTLLEGQFDMNAKFKSTINSLESEELRSKPLGKDKLGRIYWLQVDPVSNIRVYREDTDEESWTLVAQDRPSLVNLLQELSGGDYALDLNLLNGNNEVEGQKPSVDTGQDSGSDLNTVEINGDVENIINANETGCKEESVENLECANKKITENNSEMILSNGENGENGDLIVKQENDNLGNSGGEENNGSKESVPEETLIKPGDKNIQENLEDRTIEEPVMYIVGEGDGEDCMTGNPEGENSEKESEHNNTENIVNKDTVQNASEIHAALNVNAEKLKATPKLWTIDTICGVSDEKKSTENLNSEEKSEKVDLTLKQKNYSTFSIDSVLEKKELSAENSSNSSVAFKCCESKADSVPVETKIQNSTSEQGKCPEHLSNEYEPVKLDSSKELLNSEAVIYAASGSVIQNVDADFEKISKISSEKVTENNEKIEVDKEENNSFRKMLSKSSNIDETNITQDAVTHNLKSEVLPENDEAVPESSECSIKFGDLNEEHEKQILTDKMSNENDTPTEENLKTDNGNFKEIEVMSGTDRSIDVVINSAKSTQEVNEDMLEKPEEFSHNDQEALRAEDIKSEKNVDEVIAKKDDVSCYTTDTIKEPETRGSVDNVACENLHEVSNNANTPTPKIESSDTKSDSNNSSSSNSSTNSGKSSSNINEVENVTVLSGVAEENAEIPPENSTTNNDQYSGIRTTNEQCVEVDGAKEIKNSVETTEVEKEIEKPDEENDIIKKETQVEIEEKEQDLSEKVEKTNKEKICEIQPKPEEEKLEVADIAVASSTLVENIDTTTCNESLKSEEVKLENETDNVKKEPLDDVDVKSSVESQKEETRKRQKPISQPSRVLSRNRKTIDQETKSEEASEASKTRSRRRSKILESDDVTEKEMTSPTAESTNETSNLKDTGDDQSIDTEEKNDEKEGKEELEEKEEGEKAEGEKAEGDVPEDVDQEQPETTSTPKASARKGKSWRRRRKGKIRWRSTKESAGKIIAKDVENAGEDENEDGRENERKDENSIKKKGRPKKEESDKLGGRQIAAREIKLLGITNEEEGMPTIRQSRRIAQIKMKEEAERRRVEALHLETFKKKQKPGKSGKRKGKKNADSDSFDEKEENDEDESDDAKPRGLKEKKSRKKKKDKLVFNELNPWESSSGSSTADDEEEEIEEEPHEDEELLFKSDHEFSPESDVEDPDYKPMKRARTAKVEESKEEGGKYDDTSCEKCGKNDHPEWILLCDKCDKGWHASCVRPALMIVPEGDWYCPPCEHLSLIQKLQDSLVQYDRCQKQREIEETRKKRLAFVGISLDNVLPPAKKSLTKNEDESDEEESGSGSGSHSDSGSETDSDSEEEPIYQLRQRRSNVTSYRYNEYDEMIKSALQDEMEAVKGSGNAGRGKDISNIVNAEKKRKQIEEEKEDDDDDENKTSHVRGEEEIDVADDSVKKEEASSDSESKENATENKKGEGETEDEEDNLSDEIHPVVSRSKKKKSKSVKITSLDFTSEEEDHNSDSDFKGGSSEEESDYSLQSESESSDGRRRKRGGDGPLRRSTRARISRYDRDFINDDSDDSPKRKRNRRDWDSTESSDSDRSWGRKKRKAQKSYGRSSSKKSKSKKKKQRTLSLDSDGEESASLKKKKNRKIKYGGLDSLDEESVLSRRTRGKKINYQEITGSDSEDNGQNRTSRSARIIESDDDFVAENEKEEEAQDEGESDEIDEDEEEEEEDDDDDDNEDDYERDSSNSEGGEETNKKKKQSSKMSEKEKKKKKWVIPDPDDFSENDLMEDEQLDKFTEELDDLNEDEEEILGNMLESGDVPIHELKAAVKRAKEENKARKEDAVKNNETEEKDLRKTVSSPPPTGSQSEYPGSKFPKAGRVKVTPSRSELASQVAVAERLEGTQPSGKSDIFIQNEAKTADNQTEIFHPNQPKVFGNSGFLLKTLQGDLKHAMDPNIPPVSHHSSFPSGKPFAMFPVDSPGVSSNSLLLAVKPEGQTSRPENVTRNIGPEFGAYQGILPGQRTPSYPPPIPTTVMAVDPQAHPANVKRKLDDLPLQSEGGAGIVASSPNDFSHVKGVQDSPPRKKVRARGKKQMEASGKHSVTIPGGLPPEGGTVITRILNSPQRNQYGGGGDSNQFVVPPRVRPQFPPGMSSHFPGQPPRHGTPLQLRPPGSTSTMFLKSHPHDPSPSGGGAINIATTNAGLVKPPPGPSLPSFNKIPTGLPVIPPRFVMADPTARQMFQSQNPGARCEFPFGTYYGAFPPTGAEGSPAFQSGPFQEPFGEEGAIGGVINPKQLDDEVGGEFGGLASYFASQRQDDLDT